MSTSPDPASLLATMREQAKGLSGPRLEADWFAVDAEGRVAFFIGGERGPVPRAAIPDESDDATRLLAEHRAAMNAADENAGGYRDLEQGTREPIFDAPRASSGATLHESPIPGYPLLVTGRPEGSERVRTEGTTWSAREVLVRQGFGLVFDAIGPDSYADLHASTAACDGCRVLDLPDDPRPRSLEALTASGLFVYLHGGGASEEPYRRVATPSVPARLTGLPAVVATLAQRVALPITFDRHDALYVATLTEVSRVGEAG